MRKRFFTFILSFCFLLSIMAVPSFAVDDNSCPVDGFSLLNLGFSFYDGEVSHDLYYCSHCGSWFYQSSSGWVVFDNNGTSQYTNNNDGSGTFDVQLPDDSLLFNGVDGGGSSGGGTGGSFGYSGQGVPAVSADGRLRYTVAPTGFYSTDECTSAVLVSTDNPFNFENVYNAKSAFVRYDLIYYGPGVYSIGFTSADRGGIYWYTHNKYYPFPFGSHLIMYSGDNGSTYSGSVDGVNLPYSSMDSFYVRALASTGQSTSCGYIEAPTITVYVTPTTNSPTTVNNINVNGVLVNGDFKLYNNNYFSYNDNGDVNIYYTDESGDVVSSSTYNTTNNVYYITVYNVPVIPEPTPEPTATPETPTPTPTPVPGGDGSGGDSSNPFGELLATVLGSLLSLILGLLQKLIGLFTSLFSWAFGFLNYINVYFGGLIPSSTFSLLLVIIPLVVVLGVIRFIRGFF